MLRRILGVFLTMVALTFYVGTSALADQPNEVGNRIQLEPGMHPVVIAPPRAGELVPNKFGGALYTGTANTSAITYTYNNSVIKTPKVSLIWYGSWKSSGFSSAPTTNDYYSFTNKFVSDYASNARWNLNRAYYSATSSTTKDFITDLSTISNVFIGRNDTKYGKNLSQSSILNIAKASLNGSSVDPSTIYLVLTSSDVAVSGFNAGRVQFCGWHSASGTMKYGFVGDSANATYCQGQTGVSPNNNPGADAMMSVLAHEIEEAATDPYVTGVVWRDASGNENADKCAWTWGTPLDSTRVTGAKYNWVGASGTEYLIQQGFKLGLITYGAGKDTWSGTCANS